MSAAPLRAGDDGASDADLLVRLRRGDERAVVAFWERFEPRFLEIAQRFGVPARERNDVASELLGDILAALTETTVIPRSLTGYVVVSFSNRLLKRVRGEQRRVVRETRAYDDVGNGGERAALECCSEYSLRAAGGSDAEAVAPSETSHALWEAIKAGLKPDDVTLVTCVAKGMPLREAAAAIGVTHVNARVRLSRIRASAIDVARRFSASRPEAERPAIVRLLKRIGLNPIDGRDFDD